MKTLTAEEVAARHNATVGDKPPAKGHNSHGQLKSYVERFTSLADQMDELRTDAKELAKEAKGNGFDPAAIKAIVKTNMETEEKREKRESRETIVDTYRTALGMLN